MRVAVLILGLVFSFVVGIQSLIVAALEGAGHTPDEQRGGAVGIVVALCMLVGAAFALGLPRVAMAAFLVAAGLAALGAGTSAFSDLWAWAGLCALFALMSYGGYRGKRKHKHDESRQSSPPDTQPQLSR